MTDQTDATQATATPNYPQHRNGAELVGVNGEGMPVYYDPEGHRRLIAHDDPTVTEWASEHDLSPDTSVSDLVDEVRETVGWNSLTDYAEEHVPGVDGDDSSGN